jgi:hypothetical protein
MWANRAGDMLFSDTLAAAGSKQGLLLFEYSGMPIASLSPIAIPAEE